MSNEGSAETPISRVPVLARKADPLSAYLATLQHQGEIAELILRLEDEGRAVADDPGLSALATSGGVDLGDPVQVQHAIVALGRRAEQLGAHTNLEVDHLERRDLGALAGSLLRVMEATRVGEADPDALPRDLDAAVHDALALHKRNLPPRTEEEQRWWEGVEEAVQRRTLPAYLAVALKLDALDGDPRWGLLFRSPLAFGLLVAVPGLLTAVMPLSTPLVCLALALFGAFALHPLWVAQVVEPLRAIAENLAAEEARISRFAAEGPWASDAFTLSAALSDLLPLLEGSRRAGDQSEDALRQIVAAYLDEVAPRYAAEGRDERYFQHLRRLLEGRLPREYARYAHARTRWEGRLLARVLDAPIASAVLLAIVTLPFSFVASLISPFPQGIDFPLMIAMFAVLGSRLPQFLPGTAPARAALLDGIASAQSELERIP